MKLFALGLLLALFPVLMHAQRSDESVRVKVHKSQEGHTLQIEEDVPAGDAQDLEQLMNKYGMSDELKELKPGEEVEIVIRRKQGGEEVNDVTIELDRKPTTPAPTATATAPTVVRVEPKPAFLGVHYEMNFGSTVGSHITKVEPGTPAGYARIVDLRARLIAAGGHVIAPCPHDAECPLATPDWCHFSQRLQRSRAHKHLKAAELSYEDEKFSYIALSRKAQDLPAARIIGHPAHSKVLQIPVCSSAGVAKTLQIVKSDPQFKALRKLGWGDPIGEEA